MIDILLIFICPPKSQNITVFPFIFNRAKFIPTVGGICSGFNDANPYVDLILSNIDVLPN